MNKFTISLLGLSCITALVLGSSSPSATRIGVYDSRAVAVAFGNSSEGMEFVSNLRAEMVKAKAAKNDSLTQDIEKRARLHQVLNHLRAFSVGSVAEILEKHKAEVDAIAREAGVQMIVSKFELISMETGAITVDVTLPLARVFKPSEQALTWISEIQKQKPLPMLDVLAIPAEQ